jgi:hypothetical protein
MSTRSPLETVSWKTIEKKFPISKIKDGGENVCFISMFKKSFFAVLTKFFLQIF